MKVWRGILELNRAVEAETEEEARKLLAAGTSDDDWIVWVEKESS